MDDLLAARWAMALTLGFHIIFASVGMAMPFFMAVSHFLYLRKGRAQDLALTKMWSKGVAIFFATGAVSGTVLSFELGLLWPEFMRHAGAIIGMPFSWEGTAFFLEAIALGIFLYGWTRVPPWIHWSAGVVVGIAGLLSGIFVISANAWMNAPAGFQWVEGRAIDIDPVAAMFNSAWAHEALHMLLAAFQAVGFSVAGIHAWLLLKGRNCDLNRRALEIAMVFGGAAALLQPLSGDIASRWVAKHQPAKLAAMESLERTTREAPLTLFGVLEIPGMLSWLIHGSTTAEVVGLDAIPADERPPVGVVHAAFQVMVGLGILMAAIAAIFFFFKLRRKRIPSWFLRVLVGAVPLGFIAMEAGWIVTEVGRQPWIIYRVMRTEASVTPMPGVVGHLILFALVYAFLSVIVLWLMRRQIRAANPVSGERAC